jgi:hypothetical protein
MFVAMETCDDDWVKIPFSVAKVITMNRQACSNGTVCGLWHQSKMPTRLQDNVENFNIWYRNCINEDGNRQGKTMILYLLNQSSPPRKIQWGLKKLCFVQRIRIEKDFKIPNKQKYHLYHHLELIIGNMLIVLIQKWDFLRMYLYCRFITMNNVLSMIMQKMFS